MVEVKRLKLIKEV